MKRRTRFTAALLALLLCMGTLAPATGRAADTPDTVDGINNVLRYVSCALGLARANDALGQTVGWAYCISLLRDEAN